MSDEHDSWLNDAFGLDLRQSLGKIKDDAVAAIDSATSAVTQAAQEVQGAVEGAIAGVAGAAAGAAKKIAGAVAPPGALGAGQGGAGGGSGSFPLRGSVGRGGKNAASDVRAVQAALGIGVDGQCGGQTIAAIEAFQRNMGMAKADGRVDAGGGTERALAGGARPSPGSTPAGGDAGSLLDQLPGNAALPLATNAGILETAEAALIAAGEVTGVSPAARQVGAVASQAGSIVGRPPVGRGRVGVRRGAGPGAGRIPGPLAQTGIEGVRAGAWGGDDRRRHRRGGDRRRRRSDRHRARRHGGRRHRGRSDQYPGGGHDRVGRDVRGGGCRHGRRCLVHGRRWWRRSAHRTRSTETSAGTRGSEGKRAADSRTG